MDDGLEDFEIEMLKMGAKFNNTHLFYNGIECETKEEWESLKKRCNGDMVFEDEDELERYDRGMYGS